MSLLTDRTSIRSAYFRLINVDSSDDDMTEHDSSTLEGTYEALDVGAKRAQLFLITKGRGGMWLATSSALTVSGSDPDRYASLPSDFLRLDSDPKQGRSGLRYANGTLWGTEIKRGQRLRLFGNYYWLEYDVSNAEWRVHFTRGAAVPTGVVAEYYQIVSDLNTSVDFETDDMPLIAAEAAAYAMEQSWYTGGSEERQAILRNLHGVRRECLMRRPSDRNRELEIAPATGRWIV